MNKDFITGIKKICDAKEQNKLVLFVGAGVSMNSGAPSWKELIISFIDELEISSDTLDYLKIPQLYFNKRGYNEYITKIRKELKHNKTSPNPLHQLIFELEPEHIITTNFDNLLETYSENQALPYGIINEDKDLPYAKNQKFIIKMHGDLEIGNIVLKEEDYLSYSRNFPLIESYVKALFSSKLVVFLGFSYNDTNLKYIIQSVKGILDYNFQHTYLLDISETAPSELESDYLKNYGVNILNYNDLDGGNETYAHLKELSSPGKRLYTFLKYINDFDSFLIENNKKEFIDRFYNSLNRFSELNVLLPHRLKDLYPFNLYGVDVDDQNRDTLTFTDGDFCHFITNYHEEINKFETKDEAINFFEKKLKLNSSQIEKIFSVVQRLVLSGIYKIGKPLPDEEYIKINLEEFFYNDTIDLYYESKFKELEEKIRNLSYLDDIQKGLEKGYILYKLRRYEEAYELLLKVGFESWKQGRYFSYYLCHYNLYNIRYQFKWRNSSEKIFETLNNLDLDNKIYYKLNKSDRFVIDQIKEFEKTDFHYYRRNIESQKVQKSHRFPNNTNNFTFQVFHVWNFTNQNYLFLDDRFDHLKIYQEAFTEFLSSYKNNQIVSFHYFQITLALQYFTPEELKNVLIRKNISNFSLEQGSREKFDLGFENLFESIKNLLSGELKDVNEFYSTHFVNLLNNYLILYSYLEISTKQINKILQSLKNLVAGNYRDDLQRKKVSIHRIADNIQFFIKVKSHEDKKIDIKVLFKLLYDISHDFKNNNFQLIVTVTNSIININPTFTIETIKEEDKLVGLYLTEYTHFLTAFYKIVSESTRQKITKALTISLDNRFSIETYNNAVLQGIINYKEHFNDLIDSIYGYQEKMKGFGDSIMQAEIMLVDIVYFTNHNKKDKNLKALIDNSLYLKFWLDHKNFDFQKDEIDLSYLLYNSRHLAGLLKNSPHKKTLRNKLQDRIRKSDFNKKFVELYFEFF